MSAVHVRTTSRSLKAFLMRRAAKKPFTREQEALLKKLEAAAARSSRSLTAFLRSRE